MNTNIEYLLIDTEDGLKIVSASDSNFFNPEYAVQFIGGLEACKNEKARMIKEMGDM